MIKSIQNIFIIFKNFFQILNENNSFFLIDKNVDNFYNQIVYLGPLYIKFCQLIAQKTSLLNNNDYLKKKLMTLQDNSPIHSFDDTKKIFKQNYDCDIDIFFNYLDKDVKYSGSISQIYFCKIDEEDKLLIMKIKHPDIKLKIENNIYEFKIVVKFLKLAGFKFLDVLDLESFYNNLLLQTNFIEESKNLELLYQKYESHSNIKIPKLKTFSEDIIIQEFIDGYNYDSFIKNNPAMDLECKIKTVKYYLDMVLVNKMAHLDCHNGNILYYLDPNNNLIVSFIDLGLFSHINSEDRDIIGNLIKSINYKNEKLLLESLIKSCINPIEEHNILSLINEKDVKYFFDLKTNNQSFTFIKKLLIKLLECGVKIKSQIINIILNISLILESLDLDYDLNLPIFDYVIFDILENEDNKLKIFFKKIINENNYKEKKKIINEFYILNDKNG